MGIYNSRKFSEDALVSKIIKSKDCLVTLKKTQKNVISFTNYVDNFFLDYQLVSVRLWNFKGGGSLKATFLAKNQYSQRELLYFENTV